MYCHQCGKQISNDFKYCVYCGAESETYRENHFQNQENYILGFCPIEQIDQKTNKKKKLIIMIAGGIIILAVLGMAIFYFLNERHDFRNVNWGMTIEQVRATETSKNLSSETNELSYKLDDNRYFEGVSTITTYKFEGKNNTLSEADIYIFDDEYQDTSYITDLFDKKYGKHHESLLGIYWEHAETRIEVIDFGIIIIKYSDLYLSEN